MDKILITGGGTGGHLAVAKAFAVELKALNLPIFYIGSSNGQEVNWFSGDELFEDKLFLDSQGVVNKKGFAKIKSLKNIYNQSKIAKQFIKKHNITKTISVGGYSAAPSVFASLLTNTPLFIHEQNSIIGNLNKITFFFAKKFYSSYHNFSPIRDYPINKNIFNYQRIRKKIDTIIFLGGSQGARFINEFAIKIAPKINDLGIKIIHQCGKKDFKFVTNEYQKLGIKAEVFDFSNNLYEILKEADFAISRAGASTLWELSASGIPTLFIPYPYAANNHQYYNAKFLFDKGLCLLKEQDKLNYDIIDDIFKLDIKNISQDLILLIDKDGAKKIIEDILI